MSSSMISKYGYTLVIGSVRSGVFQKLLFVDFMITDPKSPLHLELSKIYRECNLKYADSKDFDPKELEYYLKPEHVMKLIGCNRRTAIEYIEVLNYFRGKFSHGTVLDIHRQKLEDEGMSWYDIYSGPSSLREHYPAIDEGQDNDRSPPPLPTWYYRFVMDRNFSKEEELEEEEEEEEEQ